MRSRTALLLVSLAAAGPALAAPKAPPAKAQPA